MMMLTSGFDLVFVVVVVERVRVVVEESGGNGVYQKYNQLKKSHDILFLFNELWNTKKYYLKNKIAFKVLWLINLRRMKSGQRVSEGCMYSNKKSAMKEHSLVLLSHEDCAKILKMYVTQWSQSNLISFCVTHIIGEYNKA